VNVLVVENRKLLSEMVMELISQAGGGEGGFVLSNEGSEMSISRCMDVVMNPFSPRVNERDILNHLHMRMKEDSLGEDMYLSLNALLTDISRNVQQLMDRQSVQLECNDINVASLLKSMNVRFSVPDTVLERVCDHVDILSEYRGTEIFVFINLKSFIGAEDLRDLYSHIMYRKKNILLIESHLSERMDCESVRVIDEDLCEISLSNDDIIYRDLV